MISKVVVDTCVASYILKGDSRAQPYLELLAGKAAVFSFMTVAELYRWPRQRQWGDARTRDFLIKVRTFTVLPYNDNSCWNWSQLMDLPGRPMPSADAWIAASALAYKLPLATHNKRDFEHVPDIELISLADMP